MNASVKRIVLDHEGQFGLSSSARLLASFATPAGLAPYLRKRRCKSSERDGLTDINRKMNRATREDMGQARDMGMTRCSRAHVRRQKPNTRGTLHIAIDDCRRRPERLGINDVKSSVVQFAAIIGSSCQGRATRRLHAQEDHKR